MTSTLIAIAAAAEQGKGATPITAPIAFIDLEASGLSTGSWPVEVGWCFLTGRATAMLIKPADFWSDAAWDPDAEALHRLSRGMLDRKGLAPSKVCEAMNTALAGAAVYSDAPDWDGFWLYRLFDAAKMRRTFDLLNFADLLAPVSPDDFQAAKAEAQKKTPHKHRAKDDVLHMRALYGLVSAGRAP